MPEPFDYSSLDPEIRAQVEECAGTLKKLTKPDPVEIGKLLRRVKEALPHGMFGKWLRAECEWSQQTAYDYIRIVDVFGANYAGRNLHSKSLILLASDHTPEPARAEALDRAEKGEVITATVAREIIARHKQTIVIPDAPQESDEQKQEQEPSPNPFARFRDATHPGQTSGPRPFLFGSGCSGIEGASVAFDGLGWELLFVAEIEPFCCRVLDRHHPKVPNLGDISKIRASDISKLEEEWTSSSWARRVSLSPSTVSELVWMTSVANWPSSFLDSLETAARDGLFGRTWRVCSRSMEDGRLAPSSGAWSNAGMGSPTGCLTLATSEFPSDAVESSLWDVLEDDSRVPQSYFLTPLQLSKMRARLDRYGGKLPEELGQLFGAGAVTPPPSSDGTSLPPSEPSRVAKGLV